MHSHPHRSRTAFRLSIAGTVGLLALTYSMSTYALNSDEVEPQTPTGVGTITIDQQNSTEGGSLGAWTLISQDNEQKTGKKDSETFRDLPAGSYTILVNPPNGASASLRIYRLGSLESYVQRPQTSFVLGETETVRIAVSYSMTRVGAVAIESDPSGIDFRLTGPDNMVVKGVTPHSLPNTAEGQYTVQYMPPGGCTQPPLKSLRLESGGRVSFSMNLSCAAVDKMREKEEGRQESGDALVVVKDGLRMVFTDVHTDAWFASFVATSAKLDILSGYKDEAGNFNGSFGPENNVTVAELAKIAHKLGGVSAEAFTDRPPMNVNAQGKWFSPFIASAEEKGWTIFASGDVDVLRPATRGEVLVTFFQALDLPLDWQKGNVFADVSARTPYAAAIETAAAKKIVTGTVGETGTMFYPTNPINRAEMAKMVTKMLEVFRDLAK